MTHQIREQLQATLGSAYTLERELGGGGMSRVFVAEEHRLKRRVVVKVLSPELAQGISVERFEREIQTAAALQQANIVPVLSAGETNGLPFYMMPFVEGESLRVRLARGPLSVTEVIGVLRDISKALAYAHRQGVVHRDIKPDNVLLSEGTAVVTDFGIAKAISAARTGSGNATLTQIGTSIGTPAYMAPEQAAGDPNVDHRADIYSLGAMAYELITGQAVFAGRTPQRMLAAHMSEQPKAVGEFRPDLPGSLGELVMSCLAKDPNARPQHASDIARVLDTITSGSGMQSLPPVLLGGPGMFRKALVMYASAFVIVAIVAKAAIVGIGLPDWVFPGSLIVMALGLPVVLWTGYVQRVVRRSMTATPTFTPGGTPSSTHGTMATMALKAAPHVSWYRTARGGMYAMGAFVFLIGAFMTMRALGIGPVGSLLASGALKQNDRVLLTDFSVSGGDTTLGRVVSDAVRAGMAQAKSFTMVTPGEIAAALRRMQKPVTSQMTMAIAQQIAEREGIKAILDGNVAAVGGSYIISARLVKADSGRELTSQRATASGPDKLIDAADEVARKLMAKTGESLKRVQGAPPLAQVTTASVEALRKYGEGARANDMTNDYLDAIEKLKEAVAIDSNFAEAWRKLGVAMNNQGTSSAEADSAITRAFRLRNRLGDAERERIEAYYYQGGPGHDRAKAIAAYEAVLRRGDSNVVLVNLGNAYRERREFARAETLHRAQVRRSPASQTGVNNLLGDLLAQQKLPAFDSALASAKRTFPDVSTYRWFELEVLWQRGRLDEYEQALDSARRVGEKRDPGATFWRAQGLAILRGQPEKMVALRREGARRDSTVGRRRPSIWGALTAVEARRYFDLPSDAAVRSLEAALLKYPLESLPISDRPYFSVAEAFAYTNRPDRARAILAQYRAAVRDSALLHENSPPEQRALSAVAYAEKRWADAINLVRLSDRMPDGPANSCSECLPRHLIWLFADAGMPDSAIAAFEEYGRTPWGGRKRDGFDVGLSADIISKLADAYLAKGDTTRAAKFYAEFVERWKNAEPELQPRVAAAREKLRRMSLDAPKPR